MTARRSTHDHWQQRNFCCQKFCSACVEWCRSSPKLGVASIGNKLHIRSQILIKITRGQSNLTKGRITMYTNPAYVYNPKTFNIQCQIYVTATSLISAVRLWGHTSAPLFSWGNLCNSSFQTAFSCKCKVYLHTNYTRILLRQNAACRYVYCIVYVAIFGALAVTMHFQ